jgi:hypothetical protein
MALVVEQGYNLQISIDGTIFGCARTVSFGAEREDKDATCTASKGTKESVPGQKSYSLSADALERVATGTNIPTEVTSKDLEDLFESGALFDWEFGSTTSGAQRKAGKAYVKSYTHSAGATDDATFAVVFTVTGDVTYTVNP